MSELNLIPNPQVMAVQAVVFLSQIFVVKRFLVEPYAKLKALREASTTGAESRSDEFKKEISLLSREIQAALNKTHEEIKLVRESAKADAKKIREKEIAEAHKQMSEMVQSARLEIKTNLQEERNKIRSFANTFVNEIYAMIAR